MKYAYTSLQDKIYQNLPQKCNVEIKLNQFKNKAQSNGADVTELDWYRISVNINSSIEGQKRTDQISLERMSSCRISFIADLTLVGFCSGREKSKEFCSQRRFHYRVWSFTTGASGVIYNVCVSSAFRECVIEYVS